MSFSDSQLSALLLCQYICNSFSLLSTIFIIILYFSYPRIRIFPFKLVFNLALCNSGYSIGILIGPSASESISCRIQAIFVSYFSISSVLWLLFITHTQMVTIIQSKSPETHLKKYVITSYSLPLATSVLPAFSGTFGRTDLAMCWVSPSSTQNKMLILIQLIILIFLVFLYTGYSMIQLYRSIKSIRSEQNNLDKLKYFNRLRSFSFIIFLCWTFAFINILVSFSGESFVLTALHVVFVGLQGIFCLFCFVKDHVVYECLVDTFLPCIPCLMKKSKKKKLEMSNRA